MIMVAQHRNQYHSRSRAHDPARFGSFESSNCKKPVIKRAFPGSSPKTPSLPVKSVKPHSVDQKKSRKPIRSSDIMVPVNLEVDFESRNKGSLNVDEVTFSELWAGPAYSNSPPPNSLPMPKFSLRPKRTVSLELPSSASDVDLLRISKSAPPSPTRERRLSSEFTFDSIDFATQTLRRILNLEITDG